MPEPKKKNCCKNGWNVDKKIHFSKLKIHFFGGGGGGVPTPMHGFTLLHACV